MISYLDPNLDAGLQNKLTVVSSIIFQKCIGLNSVNSIPRFQCHAVLAGTDIRLAFKTHFLYTHMHETLVKLLCYLVDDYVFEEQIREVMGILIFKQSTLTPLEFGYTHACSFTSI